MKNTYICQNKKKIKIKKILKIFIYVFVNKKYLN